MRKIHILKAIIDLVWIISMPAILLVIGLVLAVLFRDLSGLDIKINSVNFNANDWLSKTLLIISALNYLLILAALYFFRKTLRYFINTKIFDIIVISSFKKIGNLLSISGIVSISISFIIRIYYQQKISFELGLNEHIVLICLGLFFLILSEVFKIAKAHKQENDLTI
ncbi:DUF2975 domain-containing protein [Polaribacter porphyrae]|uniref:DUF2975 domain-containing protein n=1 Tax=Polaribacter porphyrae TaxID=1137780 RepID=A0A2S7WSX8_9FLAO|nr:DUF2975 domain-containing protein [Polaribacter porphyrae]PQJ80693.1 hypothetical protein BTO18_16610 [Polaribacter porphyrae]